MKIGRIEVKDEVFNVKVKKRYSLPRKVRKLALKMALSDKAQGKNVIIVDKIELGDAPKTKKALEFLKKKKIDSEKVLIVIPQKDDLVQKSFRNLPNAKVLPVEGLNVYDILWSDKLVILKGALEGIYKRVEA